MQRQPGLASDAAAGRSQAVIRAMQIEAEVRADPAQRADRFVSDWQRLLTVKLERHPIPHEVSRIELACACIEPMQFANVDLFDRSQQRDRQWAALAAMVRLAAAT
mgnify:CR=1 FL=1